MDIKNILGINKLLKINKLSRKNVVDKTDGVKKSDSVQISREAKKSVEVKKYIDIVKNSSDIRPDKVKMAKERLKRGDYSKPEVFEKVAERLSQKFTIGDKILDSLGEDE